MVLMDCHALVSPLYVGKEKAHMVWEGIIQDLEIKKKQPICFCLSKSAKDPTTNPECCNSRVPTRCKSVQLCSSNVPSTGPTISTPSSSFKYSGIWLLQYIMLKATIKILSPLILIYIHLNCIGHYKANDVWGGNVQANSSFWWQFRTKN